MLWVVEHAPPCRLTMLIALARLLGVDLIVLVAILAAMITRGA